jgi:hypothetical protein
VWRNRFASNLGIYIFVVSRAETSSNQGYRNKDLSRFGKNESEERTVLGRGGTGYSLA